MYGSKKSKNVWILLIIMLCGIVIGGLLGDLLGFVGDTYPTVSFLTWLRFGGEPFGLVNPFSIDLGIISITLGFTIKFTVGGILGLIIAVLIYRKI